MPKFTFDSDTLGRAFGIAKVVKPTSGDFAMKFRGDRLTIFSSDKRRHAIAEVVAKSTEGVEDGYESEEFYVAADRQTLLDSDLSTITLSVGDKTISVRAEGDGQVRNATLKKRADNSRRPPIPPIPNLLNAHTIKARAFEELLRQVSCSAQVKETKTEEDMKVNQVHFYSASSSAMASARYCGSAVFLEGLALDLSVVSADLPAMKAFCGKHGEHDITIAQDATHLYMSDPSSSSVLCFSRVSSNKPPFALLSADDYSTVIHVDREKLLKALQWANMTIEGTQRMGIRAYDSPDYGPTMEFRNGQHELSRLPIEIISGVELKGDFPVRVLLGIATYLGEDIAELKYGNSKLETVLEISDASPTGHVRSRHFLQAMRDR